MEWSLENWFAKFCSGNFYLKNAQRSGRPVEVVETHIIDSDRHSTCEIAELTISYACIKKILKQFGYVKELDLWTPHNLKAIHLMQRIRHLPKTSETQRHWSISETTDYWWQKVDDSS